MEAQTVTWLFFLALIKYVSTSDPGSPVKYPLPKPILSMRSEVTEGQTITINCSVESFPQSTLSLMKNNTNPQSLKMTENKLNSGPNMSLSHNFTVTSADAGWYICRALNSSGYNDSEWKELVVKVSPKHTNITQSAEKQELDGRSSVMLSCFSHSFPPIHNYSWYRRSQGEEKDELVSEHQNHTVYSNQPGVYYCIAQNEVDQSLSDPVHLFEPTGNYLLILKFLLPALFVLMIIILIVVVLRYRKKKSIQQGTTNTKSPSVFSEQLRRPEAPGNQPLPDSTPLTDINLVYSSLNLPQAASAKNPTRQKAGKTEDYSVQYAPLNFKTKIKKTQRKEEEDSVYAKVSKPTRVKKNEPESLQDYDDVGYAAARQTTNRDSSSSHQDESLYSNFRNV